MKSLCMVKISVIDMRLWTHKFYNQRFSNNNKSLNRHMNTSQVITKRLDSLPFSRWHIGMILAIGTIWIFDGYQVSLVSLFSKYILNEHSQTQYKSLATMYQLGCIIGSVCFGILAYFHGRRAVFMITLFIYGIGVIFCLMGSVFPLFLIGRLLTGVSVGGQFTAIFTAVDEFLPPAVRGRVDIAIDGTWHFGGCIASIINLVIGEIKQWKYLFAVGLLGILGLALIRRNIPESPRWLIMKKRYNEAQNVVSEIEYSVLNNFLFIYPGKHRNTIHDRAMKIDDKAINDNEKNQNEFESDLQSQDISMLQNKTYGSIFRQIKLVFQQYKIRFGISCLLIYVQAFFFSSVYYQFPILLKNLFDLSQRQISAYMLGLAICSFVSTLLVGPFFDIVGRRKMLLITYGITGLLLPINNFIKSNSIHLELLTCLIFLFGSPASSAANLVASQIFPTSTRPIILSLIFIIGMFGGMCGVWVDNYYVSGLLMLLGGILGFFFCPKAEKKSLQEINNLSARDI